MGAAPREQGLGVAGADRLAGGPAGQRVRPAARPESRCSPPDPVYYRGVVHWLFPC